MEQRLLRAARFVFFGSSCKIMTYYGILGHELCREVALIIGNIN